MENRHLDEPDFALKASEEQINGNDLGLFFPTVPCEPNKDSAAGPKIYGKVLRSEKGVRFIKLYLN